MSGGYTIRLLLINFNSDEEPITLSERHYPEEKIMIKEGYHLLCKETLNFRSYKSRKVAENAKRSSEILLESYNEVQSARLAALETSHLEKGKAIMDFSNIAVKPDNSMTSPVIEWEPLKPGDTITDGTHHYKVSSTGSLEYIDGDHGIMIISPVSIKRPLKKLIFQSDVHKVDDDIRAKGYMFSVETGYTKCNHLDKMGDLIKPEDAIIAVDPKGNIERLKLSKYANVGLIIESLTREVKDIYLEKNNRAATLNSVEKQAKAIGFSLVKSNEE